MSSIYLNSGSSSSSNSTSSSSLLRVPGMASGLDTDSIVKSMVSNYQTKIDKENQAKQTLQWKQDAYRDIIKGVKGLQDYFDPLSSKYILSSNSLNTNTATTDDSSIVSATAASTAKVGTYNMKVSHLASQANIQGDAKNSIISAKNFTDTVTPITGQKLTDKDGNTLVDLSGLSSYTGADLAAQINSKIASTSLSGKVSAAYIKDSSGTEYIDFTNLTSDTTVKYSDSSLSTAKTINSGISSTSLLSTLGFSGDDTTPGTIAFTLTSGTTSSNISLTVKSSSTVQDLIDAVKSATGGAVTMNIDDTTGKISFQSKSYGSASNITITDKNSSNNVMTQLGITTAKIDGTSNSGKTASSLLTDFGFALGNVNFTLTNGNTDYNVSMAVSDSSTVQDLINQVNTATSGAVTMSIDNSTGTISFAGTSSNINIKDSNSSNNVITKLAISTTSASTAAAGTDAIVQIKEPGQSAYTTTTQSSNKFTINGVSYNLVGVNDANNVDSNITVTGNSDTVVSNIKKFIDDYNTVISTINTKLTEKKNSDYPPLTDSQKASMSDSQITAWEAKAKVGILRNDDYLSSLLTELRGAFSAPVYSSYTSSSSTTNTAISLNFGTYGSGAIGIDTSSTDYTDGGKIYVTDETKLKDAIENNIDDFKKLFTGASDNNLGNNESYVGSSKYMEDGIFTRMDSILRNYVAAPGIGEDGTYSLTGSMNIFVNKQYDYSITGYSGKNTIPDQIYGETLSISKLKTQMSDAQTRYYNKFTALETALSTLSSQQSQLSAMLGTG